VIVCRSERALSEGLKRKISNLCDVPVNAVVNCADARNVYEIPLILHDEGLDDVVCRHLDRQPNAVGIKLFELSLHRAGGRRPPRGQRAATF
jgi:CTP synthase